MTVFLTGVTGLVGCHAAIALLQRGIRVIALARGGDGLSAESRAMRTLSAYPGWQGKQGPLSNMLVVEGDLLTADCGLDSALCDMLHDHVDVVLNCAGAISFSAPGEPLPELRVNTEGLSHVVDLVGRLGCQRLIHVSTAYVDQGSSGSSYRTEYERTKCAGEAMLQARTAELGLDAIMVRPSIVTGDCVFGFTPVFNGVYPLFRFISEYWSLVQNTTPESWLAGAFDTHAVVNLVPADILGNGIARLVEAWPEDARIFTLINPYDWPILELIEAAAECFHAHPPSLNSSAGSRLSQMGAIKKEVGSLIRLYEPYALASPRQMADSVPAPLSDSERAALANRVAWLRALLDWGMKVDWKRIG